MVSASNSADEENGQAQALPALCTAISSVSKSEAKRCTWRMIRDYSCQVNENLPSRTCHTPPLAFAPSFLFDQPNSRGFAVTQIQRTRSQAYEASEDIGRNASDNPTIGDVIAARFDRRDLL